MSESILGLQSIGYLLAGPDQPLDWVVSSIVPREGVAFLVARPGAGKSLLAYHMAACVATGEKFLDSLPVKVGAVVYVDLDGRLRIARMRAAAALRGLGLDDKEMRNVALHIAARPSSIDLRQLDVRKKVFAELATVPDLALVVLDTFSDLHHGKEQSPDDMTDVARGAVDIATGLHCGVLVVHHARKNGGNDLEDVRGASSITAKADAVFILKTEREDEDNPGNLTLLQRKSRLTAEARSRQLTLETDGDIDGRLHAYTYTVVEASPKTGRPATASADAVETATRLLHTDPAMTRAALVKGLMDAGVKKMTAYRVADSVSQKPPNPPLGTLLGKDESLVSQGETDDSPNGPSGNGSDRSERPYALFEAFGRGSGVDISAGKRDWSARQCTVAGRLHAVGWTADDVEGCSRYLASQAWRTSPFDMFAVEKFIDSWALDGRKAVEAGSKQPVDQSKRAPVVGGVRMAGGKALTVDHYAEGTVS